MKQKGYERGSILDLAILLGGGVDCAFSLCESNEVCLSDVMDAGREYKDDLIENKNSYNKGVIDLEGIRPATAITVDDMAACPYGGIGFMGVEADFEVS